MATQHGAFSAALVNPLAQRIVAELQQQASESGSGIAYLAEPTYLGSVASLARTEARIALVAGWLEKQGGDLDAAGDVRSAARLLNELEAAASRERSKLGLDPVSRAKLLAALGAANQAQQAAEAHAELRERYGRPRVVDDGGEE